MLLSHECLNSIVKAVNFNIVKNDKYGKMSYNFQKSWFPLRFTLTFYIIPI